MDIKKLFEAQKVLDDRVCEEHGLTPASTYEGRVLALLVEFGEACNEARFFKHWSKDREPREGLLEELADCLHFLLSIAVTNKVQPKENLKFPVGTPDMLVVIALDLFARISLLAIKPTDLQMHADWVDAWWDAFGTFLGFCMCLGVTPDELEIEYWKKNKVNHERQDNGY
mgnify:CR=1 FL=1